LVADRCARLLPLGSGSQIRLTGCQVPNGFREAMERDPVRAAAQSAE
jgi:hypothetical protein